MQKMDKIVMGTHSAMPRPAMSLIFSAIVLLGWDFLRSKIPAIAALLAGSGVLTISGALSSFTIATRSARSDSRIPLTAIIAALTIVFILCSCAVLAYAMECALAAFRPVVSEQAPIIHEKLGGAKFEMPICPISDGIPIQPAGMKTDPPVHIQSNIFCRSKHEAIFIASIFSVLATFGLLASLFVNVNWFSLHAFYRNRLIRTFLGASNTEMKRDSFSGYLLSDNIYMHKLKRDGASSTRLFPIVNMTLNAVGSDNLALQERRAMSFIATPHVVGGDDVKYRPAEEYAGGITLGTTMAISGAAVSPNWGYHSSRLTSVLMMLMNIRLGWRLGNPGHPRT